MRFIASLTVLAATTAALAFAAPQQSKGGMDFETLPPDHKTTQAQLERTRVSLDQAIDAAEKAMNGPSLMARFVPEGDTAFYEVVVVSNGVQKLVKVDGASGQVIGATLTLPAAVRKAVEKTGGGSVKEAVTDFTQDPPIYSVVIFKDGKRHDLVVNAVDGTIISDTMVGRFPGIEAEGEIVTLPSGLQYIDIREGTGAQPASPNAIVKVDYTGYLTNGSKFDSSVDRGTPLQIPLNQVIRGWTEGVGSMKVGGKRKLIIPYTMAYGEQGNQRIPPRATLIFDVELLEVLNVPDPANPR